jgi:hypothetical protein
MTNKHIIYIPGKNPKPQPEQHRELLWKTMTEGIRRADENAGKAVQEHYAQFHLISWNHLFYHTYKDITPDIPWIDALVNKHGPTQEDMREAKSWRNRLGRILFNIADHVPPLIPLLPKEVNSAATEMNRYFNNENNVANEIRNLLKQTLRPLIEKKDPVLLIGHSLGSVIAYDTLWELSHQEKLHGKIDFISIGSPLGMHYVRRRLLGMKGNGKTTYPKLIRNWINLSSEGDTIALERDFHHVFEPMLKQHLLSSIDDHSHGIYNYFRNEQGLNCHRSYGYLVNPAVGSTIANWWKNN